jgi:hypothetical protein
MGINGHFQPATRHVPGDAGLKCRVHFCFLLAQLLDGQSGVQLLAQGIAIDRTAAIGVDRLQAAAFGHCLDQELKVW